MVINFLQDIYIIVAPITDREYDPEKEKRLMRASKRRKLELLEAGHILGTGNHYSIIIFLVSILLF